MPRFLVFVDWGFARVTGALSLLVFAISLDSLFGFLAYLIGALSIFVFVLLGLRPNFGHWDLAPVIGLRPGF